MQQARSFKSEVCLRSSNNSQLKDKWLMVGYIKQAHGIRGEVFAPIPSGEWDWAQKGQLLHLISRTEGIPSLDLSIRSFRPHKNGLLIHFEESIDRNFAETLKGYGIYLPRENFVSEKGESPYLIELLGFEVFDKESLVGVVASFSTNGAQELLCVKKDSKGKKENLIPFVDAFVKDVNYDEKKIFMDLPEGLLE
ncbi:MAG TPA: 16S rRNA processing protein RimM [Bdellovibrionales bacterium]|nr:16S rRNA processing protein RimM [Pseudobdellovibrionaceae bacterium]HAG91758.1 16S rRNA processing protein RimM [Bdellovibrionales bacterium]